MYFLATAQDTASIDFDQQVANAVSLSIRYFFQG
jgi:hypothetical protein